MRKNIHYSILLIVLVFFFYKSYSQNVSMYTEKYRYYRERFNNYFISVGPNSGQSIPAMKRDEQKCQNTNPNEPTLFKISYDDAPNHLGFYIGMLATEYRLLKDESKDVSGILEELY